MNTDMNTYSYEESDFLDLYPKRFRNSNKGTYGRVGVIAGSKGMAGAAFLCASATYAAGAGLVRVYTHEDNRIILQQSLPEAIVTTYEQYEEEQLAEFVKWCDTIALGCGLGQSNLSFELVQYVLKHAQCPCVIDADALNLIAKDSTVLKERKPSCILTPHMKEMTRLLQCEMSELQENRQAYLQKFVNEYDVTCILKDAQTIVATPEKDIYLNPTGCSALAKGGTGDTLTGIIAAIAGQKVDLHEAACLGVYLHGKAGDIAKDKKGYYSVMAGDVVDAICEVLKPIKEVDNVENLQ